MWTKLIEDLLDSGLKEQEIVDRLKALGVETTQPTINRIKNGRTSRPPRHDLGVALINLHKSVCKPKSRPKPARLHCAA